MVAVISLIMLFQFGLCKAKFVTAIRTDMLAISTNANQESVCVSL